VLLRHQPSVDGHGCVCECTCHRQPLQPLHARVRQVLGEEGTTALVMAILVVVGACMIRFCLTG
jgi:hypothetical protein